MELCNSAAVDEINKWSVNVPEQNGIIVLYMYNGTSIQKHHALNLLMPSDLGSMFAWACIILFALGWKEKQKTENARITTRI